MSYIKNIIVAASLLPTLGFAGAQGDTESPSNARIKAYVIAIAMVEKAFDIFVDPAVSIAHNVKTKIVAGYNHNTVQRCLAKAKTTANTMSSHDTIKNAVAFLQTNQDTILVSTIFGSAAACTTWLMLNYDEHSDCETKADRVDDITYDNIIIIRKKNN